MYDSQYETTNGSTHPRLTQCTIITGNIDLPTTTDTSFLWWSSSCILRLIWPQLPATIIQLHLMTRPTSASGYDHPAAFNDSSDLSFQLWSSSFIDDSSAYASYPQLTSSCAHLRLNHTSYQRYHSSWRPNTTITDFTHVCRSDNKLSLVIFVTSLLFLHCLRLSLTHTH